LQRDLTTTSYAILGQLALRPWSAYELTKEMQRNLHYFWPRAESRIYDEIKRLQGAGLATSTPSFTGRRRRMTYEITAAGRRALASWLEEDPLSGVALESEGLLRIFEATAPQHMRAAVETIRAQAAEILPKLVSVGQEYLEERAPFQDRVRWRAYINDFLTSYALMLEEWAQRTEHAIEACENSNEDEIVHQALDLIAEKVERITAATPLSAGVED
jgi:DNA-binding PadR family transcriptional regulator